MRPGRYRLSFMQAAGLIVVTGHSALLYAQASTAAPAEEDSSRLAEIVVTAQKRVQTIEKVPASIQVMSGEAITQYQQTSLKNIAANVPNLMITASPSGANQANIRGFGSSTANSGFEQSVALYVDGVYQPRPHSFTGAIFDVDRIEVVKGTQGTVFGKNASVGAISLVTRGPGRELGGYLNGSYEYRFAETRFEGAIDLPASENLRARIAGTWGKRNKGWVRNLAINTSQPTWEEDAARATLEWDATASLTLRLKGEFSNSVRDGDAFMGVGGAVFRGLTVEDAVKNASSNLIPGGQPVTRRKSNVESLGFDWNIGSATITGLSAYQRLRYSSYVDMDLTSGPLDYVILFHEDGHLFTQELRIASNGAGPLQYLAGFFYFDQNLEFGTDTLFAPSPSLQLLTTKTQSYSGFAQASYEATERLLLTTGARYTIDDKRGVLDVTKLAGNASTGDKTNDGVFDWSLVGEYKLVDDTRLYVSASTGHKAKGFVNTVPGAALVPARLIFDGEKATNYEMGVKSLFWDGRARGNIALYNLNVQGFQGSSFNPATRLFAVSNIDARSRGVEAELQLRPLNKLQLNFSMAYDDAIDKNAHRQLPTAPKWNVTGGFDYDTPLTPTTELQFGAKYNYVTRYAHQFDLLPGNFTPGHSNLDAHIGVKLVPSGITVSLVGKNLTNARYDDFAFGYSFDAPGAAFSQSVNQPRTVAISIDVPF